MEVVRTHRKSNLSFNNCYDQENEKDPKQSLKPEVASGLGLPEPCGITNQTRTSKKDLYGCHTVQAHTSQPDLQREI